MDNKKTRKNPIITVISVIAALTLLFSLYMIISTLVTGKQEQNAFDELSELVEREKENATPELTEPSTLPEYAAIYERNSDFFGWLHIDGTKIDYPVMHTPDAPQYYLHRDFDKSDAQSGTPFLDGACCEGCGNYIIYAHHMKNGSMFGTLPEYAVKAFWEQHKTISFDTLYEHGEYEVIAAFYGEALAEGQSGFRYYKYTDLSDPTVFDEFITQVNAASEYDTGIDARYGDELITLSTCSYHTDNGRFVVVARKI